MKYDIVSANLNTGVTSTFTAIAQGTASSDPTKNVGMNLETVGSMYNFGEATLPYYAPSVQGHGVMKEITTTTPSKLLSDLKVQVATDDVATMSSSNQWGMGSAYNWAGSVATTTGSGVQSVTATGLGNYYQHGGGANALNFDNIIAAHGGDFVTAGSFTNGMTGTYSMQGS